MKRGKGVSIRHPLGEQNLPGKLAEERLKELAEKIRAGKATDKEIEEVALGHIRLAISLASKFAAHAIHLQDVFVNEALFGLAVALSKAPEKLYDENITPYIVSFMRKYLFKTLVEDRTIRIPYSTIKDRRERGLETPYPIITKATNKIEDHGGNLFELKEQINACIRGSFEREVIELRRLGFKDREISEMFQCSRSNITTVRRTVYRRFLQSEQEEE